MQFSAVSLLTSDPVDSFLEVTKRNSLFDASYMFKYVMDVFEDSQWTAYMKN